MEGRIKKALIIFLMAVSPIPVGGKTVGRPSAKQTLVCCGDAPFDHAVSLPKGFVKAWLGSKMASGLHEMLRDDPRLDLEKFHTAFRVSPTSFNDLAYVVEGKRNPVIGGGNVWFWVVETVASKPKVTLFCGALNLAIMPVAHNSHQDIRCAWESPGGDGFVEDYRFNGQEYALFRKSETHRRP